MDRSEAEAVSDSGDAEALFVEAVGHFKAGRIREASRLCGRILSSDPAHPGSFHLLGMAYHRAGRHQVAAELILRAIASNRGNPILHNNLGGVFLAQGRPDEAIACYRQALAADPDYPEAYNNLGIALRERGMAEDAVASFRKAIARKPAYAQAHYNLGVALETCGRRLEAEAAYREAVGHEPGNADAHFALGDLLESAGEAGAAADHLRRYLELEPDDPSGAGLLLARSGRAPPPPHASTAHLLRLYSSKARQWDEVEGYLAHQLVAQTVRKLAGPSPRDVLDAGCGTGLLGCLIRDLADALDGIDLSPAMLAEANRKGVYSKLYEGDMVSLMESSPGGYDLVASAATLIHFGDLEPLFRAAATALRDGGLFIFSIYSNDATDRNGFTLAGPRDLAKGGCFAHGSGYVTQATKLAGLTVEEIASGVHEYNRDIKVPGFVVTLRRPA